MTWRRRTSAQGYRPIAVALARLVETEGERAQERPTETGHVVPYTRPWETGPEVWRVVTAAH